jgi:hypothetical protein
MYSQHASGILLKDGFGSAKSSGVATGRRLKMFSEGKFGED